MTSIIFVHGTGGRQVAYDATFQQIQKQLENHNLTVELVPCLWGDDLGAKLNAGGRSIPEYQGSQGGQQPTPEEESIQLWSKLYEDPLYEIRLLGLRPLQPGGVRPPNQRSPKQKLEARVHALTKSAELREKLERLAIAEVLTDACTFVTGPQSKPFARLLDTASSNLDDDYLAIARAIPRGASGMIRPSASTSAVFGSCASPRGHSPLSSGCFALCARSARIIVAYT